MVYQGKTTFEDTGGIGIGEQTVLHLAESVPQEAHLFFDRFFTTINVLETLKMKGLAGTGTLMRHPLPMVLNLRTHAQDDPRRQKVCPGAKATGSF